MWPPPISTCPGAVRESPEPAVARSMAPCPGRRGPGLWHSVQPTNTTPASKRAHGRRRRRQIIGLYEVLILDQFSESRQLTRIRLRCLRGYGGPMSIRLGYQIPNYSYG